MTFMTVTTDIHLHLICFQRGFVAQSVEHRTDMIAVVMGSNPVEASAFFSGLSWQLLKLLNNCEDHFHFNTLSAVHMYDIYDIRGKLLIFS